jgi:hypothetical protein
LSEPSLETMTMAPQFDLSQIAHNSITCMHSPFACVGGSQVIATAKIILPRFVNALLQLF